MEKMKEKKEEKKKVEGNENFIIPKLEQKQPFVDELEHVMQRISEAEAFLLGTTTKSDIVKARPPPIPPWSDRPWMFTRPKDERFLQSWRNDWAKYVLEWAEALIIHIISVNEMLSKDLFRKLSGEDLIDVLEYMCNNNWCKWWDKKKTLVRIYWKSLEEWKDIIWNYGINHGFYISVWDLINAKEAFSTIPREELEFMLNALVKEKRAVWADKKTKTIRVLI